MRRMWIALLLAILALAGTLAVNTWRLSSRQMQALATHHGTDERISVVNYVEMIRFYHQLLRNAAGPAANSVPPQRMRS